jgi:hypothetical protein
MAVIVITEPEGATLAMYDAVNERLFGEDATPPEGLVVHTAGEVNGSLRVVDVWDSIEAHDRFVQQRLAPAIEAESRAAGAPAPEGPPKQTVYDAHNVQVFAERGAQIA